MTEEENSLRLTRTCNAPPERIWSAWTQPEELAQWWWPARFQTRYDVDLQPGGRYRFRTVEVPGVGVLDLTGTYSDVQPPDMLAYSWFWEGSDEPETHVTVEFVPIEAGTEIRISHTGFGSQQEVHNHIQGWTDCLDRLQALVEGSRS